MALTKEKISTFMDINEMPTNPDYIGVSQLGNGATKVRINNFNESKYTLESKTDNFPKVIQYCHQNGGCTVRIDNNPDIFLKDQFYASVAGRDLGWMLRHQKKKVDCLTIETCSNANIYEPFIDAIYSQMRSRKAPLKVHQLNFIAPHQQKRLLNFWNLLDANALHEVHFWMSRCVNKDNLRLQMNQLVKTEQWKRTNRLFVEDIILSTHLLNFHHVFDGKCKLSALFPRELIVFRDKILDNGPDAFSRFGVYYMHLNSPSSILKLLGPSHSRDCQQWYYPFTGSSKYLKIQWYQVCISSVKSFWFSRVVDLQS